MNLQGGNAAFRYVLSDPSDTFQIDPNSGTLTLKNSKNLDREKQVEQSFSVRHCLGHQQCPLFQDVFYLNVSAEESSPNVARKRPGEVKIKVNVADENDNRPKFQPGT